MSISVGAIWGFIRGLGAAIKAAFNGAHLQSQIDRLEKENAELQGQVADLQERLDQQRRINEQLNARLTPATLDDNEAVILGLLTRRAPSTLELSRDMSMHYQKVKYYLHRLYERELVGWSDGVEGEVWSLEGGLHSAH